MKKSLAAVLGSAALIGAAVFTAPTASAADQTDQATAGKSTEVAAAKITLYRHDGYTGGYCSFTADDSNLSNNDWIGAENSCSNGASSMHNYLSREVVLYQYSGYTGRTYLAEADSSDSDFTNNGFDNLASSLDVR